MRKASSIALLALAPLMSCATSDVAPPRLLDYARWNTAEGFRHDAVTATYWHMLSIACPFSKSDVDDLEFLGMVMFMTDGPPRITPELQASVDREADGLARKALAHDREATCRAAVQDMQADAKLRMADVEKARDEAARSRAGRQK